jgi:hypothetical protein
MCKYSWIWGNYSSSLLYRSRGDGRAAMVADGRRWSPMVARRWSLMVARRSVSVGRRGRLWRGGIAKHGGIVNFPVRYPFGVRSVSRFGVCSGSASKRFQALALALALSDAQALALSDAQALASRPRSSQTSDLRPQTSDLRPSDLRPRSDRNT